MSIAARTGRFTYFDGSTELEGFLAVPTEPSKAARPVVLVIHAWAGQDDFARAKAHMLAELGYLGVAIDVYGTGRRGSTQEECSKLMTPWLENRAALRTRLLAGVAAAKTIEGGDPERLGVIGFCFGGLCALDLARANAPGLRAAVAFHGLFNPPNIGSQPSIKSKVLALHGYDDPMCDPQAMRGFADEMRPRTPIGSWWPTGRPGTPLQIRRRTITRMACFTEKSSQHERSPQCGGCSRKRFDRRGNCAIHTVGSSIGGRFG